MARVSIESRGEQSVELHREALTAEKIPGERRERVDVVQLARRVARELLGAREALGAAALETDIGLDVASLSGSRNPTRDPEIQDPGRSRFVDEDVGRFDVAMHDPLTMRVRKRIGNGDQGGEHLRNRAPPEDADVRAVHVSHGDEARLRRLRASGCSVQLIDGHDVGMDELAGVATFASEEGELFGGRVGRDDFRHDTIGQLQILDEPHVSHTSLAERTDESEAFAE